MRLASEIAGVLLCIVWAGTTATAQSPIDSIAKGDGGPTRTWLSVGVGGRQLSPGWFCGAGCRLDRRQSSTYVHARRHGSRQHRWEHRFDKPHGRPSDA
jgi:hypothetical protein